MSPAFLTPPLSLPARTHHTKLSTCRPRRTRTPHASLQPSTPTPVFPTAAKPVVTLTPYENNTFSLSTAFANVLIDPWLTDDLVFLTPSFFRGRKPPPRSPATDYTTLDPSTVDFIALTQGLPDHAHPPTLRKLPKRIPVIAPASALSLLKQLGFENVTVVSYGDEVTPVPGVVVHVLRGSVVGPPWSPPELAYIFEFGGADDRTSVYHEPHGNHDVSALRGYRGNLDAVIAPIVSTTIPVLGDYSLVNGVPEAMEVCRLLRPKTCVAFDNSGGVQTGFLTKYLKKDGGVDRFVREVEREPSLRDMNIVRTDIATEPVVIAGK